MILNKFIRFIIEPRLIFPALTVSCALFRKHLARFATPLTAQVTSRPKLTENERNTGMSTTRSSGKGVKV